MQPVCLEDILPTLADLRGAKRPDVDGVSLLPALKGDDTEIRPWLHFEHAAGYSPRQAFHALTDGHVKYVWRPADGAELLFDLGSDPHEEHNRAQDESSGVLVEQWRARLIQLLAPRTEGFSDGQRLIPGRPYPPLQPGVPRAASSSDPPVAGSPSA